MRHGETEWNKAQRIQGHLDSPLTENGLEQARVQGLLLEQVFEEFPDMPVLSSPQTRAWRTAGIALEPHQRTPQRCDDLREISAGSWDGVLIEEIADRNAPLFEQARSHFELMFMAPDGEGEATVLARAQKVLSDLQGPSLLVAHGGTLAVLRGLLRGLEMPELLEISSGQGCIYRIENGREEILQSN
jgi:broad specificity phosphatase PhoE